MHISIYNKKKICYNIIKQRIVKRTFDNDEVFVCLLDEKKNFVS